MYYRQFSEKVLLFLIYENYFLKWKEWSVKDLPKLSRKLVLQILLETWEKDSLLG